LFNLYQLKILPVPAFASPSENPVFSLIALVAIEQYKLLDLVVKQVFLMNQLSAAESLATNLSRDTRIQKALKFRSICPALCG